MTCNCRTDPNGNLLDIGCTEHGEMLEAAGAPQHSLDAYENCRDRRARPAVLDFKWFLIGLGIWLCCLAGMVWWMNGRGM